MHDKYYLYYHIFCSISIIFLQSHAETLDICKKCGFFIVKARLTCYNEKGKKNIGHIVIKKKSLVAVCRRAVLYFYSNGSFFIKFTKEVQA